MASIYEVAKDHSRRIRNLDKQTAARIFAHYALAFGNIREEYERILRMAAAAAQRGEAISESWVRRKAMLEQAMARIGSRLNQLSASVSAEIASSQRAAIELGSAQAIDTMSAGQRASTGRLSVRATFSRAPVEAMEQMIGFVGDGSPLRAVLSRYGEESREAISETLVTGIVEGKNPRTISREIREQVDGNRAKALTIARTEVLRAHRAAALENYRENMDVVEGWMWMAQLDARTCVVCWAMHGTVHPLSEDFGTHPNCRCSPLPVVRGARIELEPGVARFERLSEEEKLEVLGKKAYAQYQSGRLSIVDLVGREDDRRWGPVRYRLSLDDAITRREERVAQVVGGGQAGLAFAPSEGESIDDIVRQVAARVAAKHNGDHPVGSVGSTTSLTRGDMEDADYWVVSVDVLASATVQGRFVSADDVEKFIRDQVEYLKHPRGTVGTWFDPELDRTFLDVSFLVKDRYVAEAAAKRQNQKAIFHLRTKEVLEVSGTGHGSYSSEAGPDTVKWLEGRDDAFDLHD